ncbi:MULTISPECIES: hypothetical protein [unclassified Photobacterium]|uniref:hypothetical protein n=1 Tax=unclassified Photobacterium TaxID=2628852 RepID=UPI001EDF8DA2|nr:MULTISPECIES: hypothetical protein [unclassified Photobacterium]MCG3863542.1 hypothetical protein [Photobacterium sp. Ph6]MCG3875071.1 hypothetical protein [Photobacterium sp. Ph5]
MKRVITTLVLSLTLHSLSAFAITNHSSQYSQLITDNTIKYLDHTQQLNTNQLQQSHVLTAINNNNYLSTTGHKEGHLERKRWEDTRLSRSNNRYREEHKNK